MKKCNSILYSLMIFILATSCSSDPEEQKPQLAEEETQTNLLAKTWILGEVLHESEIVTERFEGFTLTFTTDKKYLSTHASGGYDEEPFKASGSWDFKNGNLNVISRDDGVDMDVVASENNLMLVFFLISESSSRIAGLGEYRFELISQ